jgi:hypothetical protein
MVTVPIVTFALLIADLELRLAVGVHAIRARRGDLEVAGRAKAVIPAVACVGRTVVVGPRARPSSTEEDLL